MKHEQLAVVAIFTCFLGYGAGLTILRLTSAITYEDSNVAIADRWILANDSTETTSQGSWAENSLMVEPPSASPALVVQECSHNLGSAETSLLVQEPARRSAYRPDFSGSLRNSNYRSNFFMLQAFREALDGCWQSTVQVYCDSQQCAYGTIIDQDGWIITKASELDSKGKIHCILSDQREYQADLISTLTDLDLALLHIPIDGLTAVHWEYSVPIQGKWLATTDTGSELPAAIGVVSAGPSKIPSQKAVLGVELAPDDPQGKPGAKIKHVLSGSGADLAGLRKEDVIASVNGSSVNSRDQLLALLKGGQGGQFLDLVVYRREDVLERRARLMDLSYDLLDATEMEVNGPISARSSGFNRVFMHDTVLQPNQCGGPLVNLDGKVVGINIARAGRVSTYALPADTVRPAVQGLLEQAKLVSLPTRAEGPELRPVPTSRSNMNGAQDEKPLATAP